MDDRLVSIEAGAEDCINLCDGIVTMDSDQRFLCREAIGAAMHKAAGDVRAAIRQDAEIIRRFVENQTTSNITFTNAMNAKAALLRICNAVKE